MPKINPSSRPVWAGQRVAYESSRVTKRWGGYNTPAWRTFSKWFKDNNLVCCVEGCKQPTYYTDHVIRVLDWIAQGGNPLDPANCQPLCYKHGNKKTGQEGRAKQIKRDGGGKNGEGGGVK